MTEAEMIGLVIFLVCFLYFLGRLFFCKGDTFW